MKRIWVLGMTVFLLICLLAPAGAAYEGQPTARFTVGSYDYEVNGVVSGMDATPFIQNGRVYVPVRYLGISMRLNVNWDPDTQSVNLSQEYGGSGQMVQRSVTLYIGQNYMDMQTNIGGSSDSETRMIDVAPVIREGRTYLPARYVAEYFPFNVEWNAQAKCVNIWPGTMNF